jgi:uncharacterized membrane protein YeaQ/YmgE (transglycosylase-associated protein family)
VLNKAKTEIIKWTPPVAVILVGVAASQLVTKDKGTGWQVLGAMVGGVGAAIAGHHFGVI